MAVKQRQSVSAKMRSIQNKSTHDVNLKESGIIVPTDQQARLKQQIESNTTILGISAQYTGASFDTMADGVNFTGVTGLVTSNQAGTLYIDQSPDGTNWYTTDTIAVSASGLGKINFDILVRYLRVRYVNGATAQTSFNLSAFVTFK
jgi:hypothetical protein